MTQETKPDGLKQALDKEAKFAVVAFALCALWLCFGVALGKGWI